MADLRDIFDEQRQAAADERRRLDFDDLQNELAGWETGRMRRFLNADARDGREVRGKRERDASSLSRLQLLLASDPAYKALYDETFDKLREAEKRTADALTLARAAERNAQTQLDGLIANAAMLPDGTRVFRDKDGKIWRENGTIVGNEDAASIVWRGDEPSYEDYRTALTDRDASTSAVAEIERYQVETLGTARDRLTDEDNPLNSEELQRMQKALTAEIPEVKNRLEDAQEVKGAAINSVPDANSIPQI